MKNKTKKITLIIISIALLLVLSVGGFFLWKKISSNKQQDVTVTEVTPIEDSNELANEETEKNTYSEEIQTESENVEDVLNKGYLHPTSFLGTEEEKFLSSLKELGFTNVKKIGTVNSNFSKGTISYYSPDGNLKLDTLIEYRVSLGPKVSEKNNINSNKDKTSISSENNNSENNSSQGNKPDSDNNNPSSNGGQEDKPTLHVHSYTSTVIQPTCEIEGYTEYKCSCGDSYKGNYTEKLNHTYVDTIVAPTCEHKGYTEHKCSVCGYTYKDNYIDAIGHDFSDNSEMCKNSCGAENPEYVDPNKPADTEDFVYNDNVYKDDEMVVSDTVTTNIKNLKPGDIILKMEEGAYTEAVKLVEYNDGTWTYVYPTINEIFEDYQINVSPTIDYSKAVVYEQEITEAIANEMAKTLSASILFDVVSAEEITNFLSVKRENVKAGIKVVITFDIIKFINSKNLEIPKGLDTEGKITFDTQFDLDGTEYLKEFGSPDHKISVQLNTAFNLNLELSTSKGEIEGAEDVENAFKKAMITLFNGEEYKIATIPVYEGGILHTDVDVLLFLDMDMNVDLTSKYHEQNTKTFWVIYNEKTRKVTTGLDDKGPTWSYELDVYGKLEIWTGLDLRMNVELIDEHILAASLDIKVGPYLDMYGKFNFTVSNTESPKVIKTLYAEIGLRLASHFKVYRECFGWGCEGDETFFENDVFDSGKMKITSFGEKEVEISYDSSTRKVSFYDVSTNKVSDREVDDKEFCLRKNDNYDKTKSDNWEGYEYTWNTNTNKCSDEITEEPEMPEETDNYLSRAYWALYDNDNDGNADKLVLGLKDLDSTALYTGEINLNKSYYIVPWIDEGKSNYVNSVEVKNKIKPNNLKGWFSKIGYKTSRLLIDVTNIDTRDVTDMQDIFSQAGFNSLEFEIVGLDNWNTSKVLNMSGMFYRAGEKAKSWKISDISKWDVSNVRNMGSMFAYAGYNALDFSLDLSNWETSNLSNWGATSLGSISMFMETCANSKTCSIDLSNFNTSNIKDMYMLFLDTGANTESFYLNLSNWDFSNVNNHMFIFSGAGQKATTWKVVIPKATGDKVNTDSRIYVSDSSFYEYIWAPSGRKFTIQE